MWRSIKYLREDHDRQANTAAIESYNKHHKAGIEIRQVKYLNNIVEQNHPAVKRLARPTLGFKSFRSAQVTLTGIELMHMIRKDQLRTKGSLRPAQAFYSLVYIRFWMFARESGQARC